MHDCCVIVPSACCMLHCVKAVISQSSISLTARMIAITYCASLPAAETSRPCLTTQALRMCIWG